MFRAPGALLAAVAALVLAPAATAGGSSIVLGAAEDSVRSPTLVDSETTMSLLTLAGFRAVRITSTWEPGLSAPNEHEAAVLANVAAAAALHGVRVYVSVYHAGSRTTPLSPADRTAFAAYVAEIVRANEAFRDVIVGNEPNLNRFWLPQFGPDGSNVAAASYLALLAESYDALKDVSPDINVIGGSLSARGSDDPAGSQPTHSPSRFIEDLGAEYRASKRDRPVMDMFSIHPYPENSSIPPTFEHPLSTSIGLADYDKLVTLLGAAFDGTEQPGSSLPIVYGEYGLQTTVPQQKLGQYTGAEQVTTKPIDEEAQATRYADAIRIAACHPTVRMLLFFHVSDEPQLGRLQTGVFYADDTPKTSLETIARAAVAAQARHAECS